MTIDEAIIRYTDNAEYERTHGNLQGCLDFRQLAELLTELKQRREQTNWIPLSERLPEDGTWCLFIDGRGRRSVERYKCDAMDHFYPQGRFFNLEEARAWMPLPEKEADE